MVGHSMGGLIARHAVGVLFDPRAGTVAGLAPAHFVTIATPHLGCEGRPGPAQVRPGGSAPGSLGTLALQLPVSVVVDVPADLAVQSCALASSDPFWVCMKELQEAARGLTPRASVWVCVLPASCNIS